MVNFRDYSIVRGTILAVRSEHPGLLHPACASPSDGRRAEPHRLSAVLGPGCWGKAVQLPVDPVVSGNQRLVKAIASDSKLSKFLKKGPKNGTTFWVNIADTYEVYV